MIARQDRVSDRSQTTAAATTRHGSPGIGAAVESWFPLRDRTGSALPPQCEVCARQRWEGQIDVVGLVPAVRRGDMGYRGPWRQNRSTVRDGVGVIILASGEEHLVDADNSLLWLLGFWWCASPNGYAATASFCRWRGREAGWCPSTWS
jgi:hypothetical protein